MVAGRHRWSGCPRKRQLRFQRELAKLERSLGGIKDMNGLPDALFVIDVGYQKGAVHGGQQAGYPGGRPWWTATIRPTASAT